MYSEFLSPWYTLKTMTKQHFTFREVFNFGWLKTKQHYWFLLCTFVIYGIAASAVERTGWFEVLICLLAGLSLVSMSLVIAKNESFDFSTLFDKLRIPRVVIKFLLLTLLYVIAIAIFLVPFVASMVVMGNSLASGLSLSNLPARLFGVIFVTALLTIPAIIVSVRFKFYPYVLIENDHLSFVDTIKHTFKLTQGYFWKIFTFLILISIFNILGAMSVIGLLLTIPISVFAMAHFYRHLAGHHI